MFAKAKKNRIFQDIVDQIEKAILDGQLNVGDSLPSERELQERFETSRGTLREALRVLEQKGLIEIRLGTNGGARVRGITTEMMSENLSFLLRFQRVSLEQLAEFREGVESHVTAIAANRAEPEDIDRLKRLLEEARICFEKGLSRLDDFVRVDEQIHQALAEISRNPLYIFILKTVHDNIHQYFKSYLPHDDRVLAENFQDLCHIVQAVEKRDSGLAGQLARDHVVRFNQYMIQHHRDLSAFEDPA
ncbi:MAG: FadR/GntR family transcriptional regulator [Desulfatirhabdiaceae bacterium]